LTTKLVPVVGSRVLPGAVPAFCEQGCLSRTSCLMLLSRGASSSVNLYRVCYLDSGLFSSPHSNVKDPTDSPQAADLSGDGDSSRPWTGNESSVRPAGGRGETVPDARESVRTTTRRFHQAEV